MTEPVEDPTAARCGLRKGTVVTYHGWDCITTGVVTRIEGNLCWTLYEGSKEAASFIWRFPSDGSLNTLHHWEEKPEREVTP